MSQRTILPLLLSLFLNGPVLGQGLGEALANKIRDLGTAPEVAVTLEHPPLLGLSVNQIAFGPEEGECAPEFVDSLISDFVTNGVEVVNRRRIEALVAEHQFSLSGMVAREDALELGKILGPSALVFVAVRRCVTEQQPLTNHHRNSINGTVTYQYISRTIAYFQGSIQVVDLTTAKIHSSRTIDQRVQRENRSSTGQPEFPSRYDVLDQALGLATEQVHRLFFPWTEYLALKFFNDERCNLRLAYNLVRGGDIKAAQEQSLENAEACRTYEESKPKLAARARYNLGLTDFLLGDYDAALSSFDAAIRLHPENVFTEAMADCRRARESAMALEATLLDEAPAEGKAVATTQPASSEGQVVGHPEAPMPSAPEKTLEERLQELEELYRKGLISKEVYEKKQADLLKEI